MMTSPPQTKRQRAAVIILAADRVLLIHRYSASPSLVDAGGDNHGREYYIVPGGGVEPGETVEQAALREIKEETGLEIELDRKLWDYVNRGHPETYFLATRFSGKLGLGGPELAEQSAENIFQLEWIRLNQMPELPLKPEFIKEKLLDELGGHQTTRFLGE